jgi:hypothetical protein
MNFLNVLELVGTFEAVFAEAVAAVSAQVALDGGAVC